MNRLYNFYRNTIKNSIIGKLFHKILIKIHLLYKINLSDRAYAFHRFNLQFSYKLNLENPKSLNEKIQWLKLNDRTPLHTVCADKYAVRAYVNEKLGNEDILIPLLYYTADYQDIVPENLPEKPFILKANHTSGHNVIVKDKSQIDWQLIRNKYRKWLKINIYKSRKEWQYKNIPPKILVEELLLDENGELPIDYKFHCFHGEVKYIQVDIGRGSETHYRNWYDVNWKRAPFKWTAEFNGKTTEPADFDVDKPMSFEQMIEIAKKLSKDFVYVRIDLYDIKGKVYFGEITFHQDSGNRPIEPTKYDFELGDLIDLSLINKN